MTGKSNQLPVPHRGDLYVRQDAQKNTNRTKKKKKKKKKKKRSHMLKFVL